jgi:hypothetical protein
MAGAETYAVRDMERMAEGLFLKVSWLWRR